jgi:uncharacterized Zn finger protein
MDELILDDDGLVCPDCGSPEKNETDIEVVRIQDKKSYIYHYSCTKCGQMWFVRKSTKED